MLKLLFFICAFFAARDIYITHDFSLLGNTIGITYLYDFLIILCLYFLPFVFMYLFITINIKEIKLIKYLNNLGNNFLGLYNLYSNSSYRYKDYNSVNNYNLLIFILGLLLFCLFYYFNNNLTLNITINITITFLLSFFKKKPNLITSEEVLKDFYKSYIEAYEKIKNKEVTFGKYKGKTFQELPDTYLDWISSDDFVPNRFQHNMILVKRYSEYKESKLILENKIKEILNNKKENIDIEIEFSDLFKFSN